MSVKAPVEKNFRRAKVRPGLRGKKGAMPVLRALSWRAARWSAAVLVVAYAGYRAAALVVHASGLQVRNIAVHGNVRISSGEVQAIVDGLRGSSILTAGVHHHLPTPPAAARGGGGAAAR